MRVYLAAAMTNPDRELEPVAAILEHLESRGHQVPTRHVASPTGRAADSEITHRELALRDLRWIDEAAALIAEVSVPSHGVGVEVSAAAARGIPVLLLHRQGARVSRLLLGLVGVETSTYRVEADIRAALDSFLKRSASR